MDGSDIAPASAPAGVSVARRLALLLLICALALTPEAQEPAQTTTFQTTSNLVVLDVVVTEHIGSADLAHDALPFP